MEKAPEALLSNRKVFVAFARKRLGDHALAEDVVQESLLKALRAAHPPERDEEMVTWFYRILRRSIIDLYRRRSARTRALDRFQAEFREEPTAAEEKRLCRCFERLLPGLPASQAVLLQRVDLGGETVQAVAADLGLTANNAGVRLHRARKRLRAGLEQTCRTCSRHGCLDCTC